MDEVVGLLAEQIAKRVRAARQSAALAAAQTGQPAAAPQKPPLAGTAAGQVRMRAQPSQGAAPIAAESVPARRLRRDMPPETLPVLPALDAVVASPGPASPGAGGALLAAFRGGPPLLAALVLGEALGPPLSLQPFDARLR